MQGRLFEFQLGLFGLDYTLPFPSYFVLLIAGFLFATVMGTVWARRVGQNPDVVVDLGLAMLLAGVAGGRLLHVFADGYFWDYVHLCTDPSQVSWPVSRAQCSSPEYGGYWDMLANTCRPKQADCFAWARFYAGGLTYYGGFIAASGVAVWLLKVDRFPFWKAADMAGMVIPIGLGFGRLGCLLAGCCFGSTCSLPWALSFPGGSPASESQHKAHQLASAMERSLPVHPAQLYESLASFALAGYLILYFHGRKRYDGQVFLVFVAAYAAIRFVLEFFRSDDRGGLIGISTSQWIGVALLIAAYVLNRRRAARALSAPDAGRLPPATSQA